MLTFLNFPTARIGDERWSDPAHSTSISPMDTNESYPRKSFHTLLAHTGRGLNSLISSVGGNARFESRCEPDKGPHTLKAMTYRPTDWPVTPGASDNSLLGTQCGQYVVNMWSILGPTIPKNMAGSDVYQDHPGSTCVHVCTATFSDALETWHLNPASPATLSCP